MRHVTAFRCHSPGTSLSGGAFSRGGCFRRSATFIFLFSCVSMPVGIPTPFNQLHCAADCPSFPLGQNGFANRSEEHTSELQSLMRISYAVFCLKKTIQDRTKAHHLQRKSPQHHTYILYHVNTIPTQHHHH